MRFFIDTEFIENGPMEPIELISIGIATEQDVCFYGENLEFRNDRANPWVRENVLPHLGLAELRSPLAILRDKVRDFIVAQSNGETPEFWGYYADYDWVVFCQMFGAMVDLPRGWPMYCRDLKQWCDMLGNPQLPKQASREHNALNDARWNRDAYRFLAEYEAGLRKQNQWNT